MKTILGGTSRKLLVGAALVIAGIAVSRTGMREPAPSTVDPLLSQKVRAANVAASLKAASKDPEAFVMQSVIVMKDGSACYNFRAKNAYGATLPGAAVLTRAGDLVIKEDETARFAEEWANACGGRGEQILPTLKIMKVA